MKIKSFLKLVEIQTKVASITPFLLGTVYAYYHFAVFNVQNFIFMLVSLLCIDMCTTTINNYIDYKKANKREGYGYESHNAIVRDNIKEKHVLITIFTLLTVAILFGILLYLNTNEVVLILGGISFLVGIFYTFGPVPISRTPFGEILSGGFMGLLIPFTAMYIHVYDENIIDILYESNNLSIDINVKEVLKITLISLPAAFGIANIMLANNICDIDDDIENKRYTLPIYIGKTPSLVIFNALYYIGYIAIIVALILRILPLITSISLLTFVVIFKNLKAFNKTQLKSETFVLSVKNFVLNNLSLVFTIGLGVIIDRLL